MTTPHRPICLRIRRATQGRPSRPARRQRGVALIIGLVILVLLAMMGTAAFSVATQEERMAGNARDHARAFEAAEYALRQCEKAVLAGPVFTPIGAGGMYTAPAGIWVGDGVDPNAWSPYGMPPLNGVGTQPRCIAETFDTRSTLTPGRLGNLVPHTARVTAAGYGMNLGTKVTLVSYVNY